MLYDCYNYLQIFNKYLPLNKIIYLFLNFI